MICQNLYLTEKEGTIVGLQTFSCIFSQLQELYICVNMQMLFAIMLQLTLIYKYNWEEGNDYLFLKIHCFLYIRKLGERTNMCV